jgi:hypothetical protein
VKSKEVFFYKNLRNNEESKSLVERISFRSIRLFSMNDSVFANKGLNACLPLTLSIMPLVYTEADYENFLASERRKG